MNRTTPHEKALAILLVTTMILSVMAFVPAAAGAQTLGTAPNAITLNGHLNSNNFQPSGRTLVVDNTLADPGENTDNDTEFTTLQAAVNHAQPGDTIKIRGGTYSGSTVVDREVWIVGAGAGNTILTSDTNTTLTLGTDNIHLEGVTVKAPTNSTKPALKVTDVSDPASNIWGVTVVNNVFVGHGDNGHGATNVLVLARPYWGTTTARNLVFKNNEFTGGHLDWSPIGTALYVKARGSTFVGNTFNVYTKDATVWVDGPGNSFTDTTINYPGPSFVGFGISKNAVRTTVDGLTVNGHGAEHEHMPVNDAVLYGVYVGGSNSMLQHVTANNSHVGVLVGSLFSWNHDKGTVDSYVTTDNYQYWTPYNITLQHVKTEGNDNHDLQITKRAARITVSDMQANSELTVPPQHKYWFPLTNGSNILAKGSTIRLEYVRSVNPAPYGIKLYAENSTIDQAQIKRKAVDGILIKNAPDATVNGSLLVNNGVGISVEDSSNAQITHNNPAISGNDVGIQLHNAENAFLKDNDVAHNGLGMEVTYTQDVRAMYNNFVSNDMGHPGTANGILALHNSQVDATWNWFGSTDGPGGNATDGTLTGSGDAIDADSSSKILYDPFLTAPKDQVVQDPDKTVHFAHDLTLEGSKGLQSIGIPGPAMVHFQVSDGANAAVWTYDASGSGSFDQLMTATPNAKSLTGYIVGGLDHGESMRVVIDYSDTQPSTPGGAWLAKGWNFIASPQYGPTEHVLKSTAEIQRVSQIYDQPDSQPMPAGANPDMFVFSYPIGSDAPGPNLSAYAGYWVFVTQSGEVSGAVPSGVTLHEEQYLIQAS